jgi:hypothetical protein
MTKCEHLIGRMGDEYVYDTIAHDGLGEMLKHQSNLLVSLKHWVVGKGEVLTPRQIADKRRGYLYRYNYCPFCGGELNWKYLIDEATK